MKAAPPTRETVLAWMADNRATQNATAAHFGLSLDQVREWRREERAATQGRALQPKRRKPMGALVSLPRPEERDEPPAATPPPPARPPARAPVRDEPPPPPVRAPMGPDVRDQLRRGAVRLSKFIAGDGDGAEDGEPRTVPDMHQVAAATQALQRILMIAPGITAFDTETTERVDADPTPGTPDGDAAIAEAVDAIPAHVLEASLRRRMREVR